MASTIEVRCEVLTFKEGLLSRVAHDLLLDVGRATLTLEAREGGFDLEARFDAGSLTVRHAMKAGTPAPSALSARDRRTIEEAIRSEVLHTRRFPEIVYRGSAWPEGDRARVEGQLVLHGVERRITFTARREQEAWRAEVPLRQPDFGIRPYSALMGALKIRPDLRLRLWVATP